MRTMDAVFKVCDAMENASLAAATVVPRCFVCGADQEQEEIDQYEKNFVSSCGNLPSKFASHHLDHFVDDNSVCLNTGENESSIEISTIDSASNFQTRNIPYKSKNSSIAPLHSKERKQEDDLLLRPDKETFGKERSWASIDGRPPRDLHFKYSKPVPGFHDPPTDDERTRGTFGTYDETYCDDSSRSLADRIELEDGGSDFDPINMTVDFDKLGLGVFGLPLQWTHVVKKKSSWSSTSHKSSSTSSTASNSSSSGHWTPKNSRDDHNSLGPKDSMHDSLGEHYHKTIQIGGSKGSDMEVRVNSTEKHDMLLREMPSFGKSREFRSFGSTRSKDEKAPSYSLKPTYITADESKLLHEESNQYKYIIKVPSDRSSTASPIASLLSTHQDEGIDLEYVTTTIPYSSLSKSSPTELAETKVAEALSPRSKRNFFEKRFRTKRSHFPRFY